MDIVLKSGKLYFKLDHAFKILCHQFYILHLFHCGELPWFSNIVCLPLLTAVVMDKGSPSVVQW